MVIGMSDKKTNPLWNLLKSVRLTLFLLALLAVASIIGTLIEQQGSDGIYYSWWFRLIIFCLAVNLIVCSVDRFPAALRRFRLTPVPDRTKMFEDAAPREISLPETSVENVSPDVHGFLKGMFKNTAVKEVDGASFFYCEKGRFSLFSVYLVHLSVLFILAGAIIGSIFGFNGYVNIPEGMAADTIVIPDKDGHKYKKLGFIVRCEKFSIDYYKKRNPEGVGEGSPDNSSVVKEYRSKLSFFANGQAAKSMDLRVNHPIRFMGVTFYQSTYGYVPGDKVRIRAINNEKDGEENVIEVEKGNRVTLPGNQGELTLSDINENLMNMMGPAALINIRSPEGQETPIWLFHDMDYIRSRFSEMFDLSPKFNPSAYSPFTFVLDEIDTVPYTGLQVASDPGVYLVFIGFIMIIAGLLMTFFSSHRRFWVRVAGEKGGVKISLAGTANKNPVGMERELDRLLLRLKVAMEGKHNG